MTGNWIVFSNFIQTCEMENSIEAPLTNLQLKLLRLYKADLNEGELLEVSGMLSDYLTKRAIKIADEAWDELKWNDEKVKELLQTKMRTPYKNIQL
jgi:hypothetical protein